MVDSCVDGGLDVVSCEDGCCVDDAGVDFSVNKPAVE